jgi:hypothetical protein
VETGATGSSGGAGLAALVGGGPTRTGKFPRATTGPARFDARLHCWPSYWSLHLRPTRHRENSYDQGTLREKRSYWQQHQRITAKPLYLELEKHPGAIHVVDDCEQLFSERSALTLLRSVLGGEHINGGRERRVSYSIAGSRARELHHYFYGAVIFVSNRTLTDEKPETRALMSRIPCLAFAPLDSEIRALMRFVARQGYAGDSGCMSPSESVEVIEFVIRMAAELQCRLDLRWIDHARGHYLTHVASGGTVDWRDMIRFHLMQTLTCFDHQQTPSGHADKGESGRPDCLLQEIALAQEIDRAPGLTRDERLRQWEQRTGLSRATYYRRLSAGKAGSIG